MLGPTEGACEDARLPVRRIVLLHVPQLQEARPAEAVSARQLPRGVPHLFQAHRAARGTRRNTSGARTVRNAHAGVCHRIGRWCRGMRTQATRGDTGTHTLQMQHRGVCCITHMRSSSPFCVAFVLVVLLRVGVDAFERRDLLHDSSSESVESRQERFRVEKMAR